MSIAVGIELLTYSLSLEVLAHSLTVTMVI
jgi:hypothetical protein